MFFTIYGKIKIFVPVDFWQYTQWYKHRCRLKRSSCHIAAL